MQNNSKVMLFGLDAAIPELVEKFVTEGKLPHIGRLIKEGVFARNCLVPFPTITASNWASIATGAWPGRHGITGYHVHHPGDPLDKIYSGFNSKECKAEYVWEAAERGRKKSILLKYSGSWPCTLKKGIQVDGCGPNPGDEPHEIYDEHIFYSKEEPMAEKINLRPAFNWKNISKHRKCLAAEIIFHPKAPPLLKDVDISSLGTKAKRYFLLIEDSRNEGYDTLILCKEKDLETKLFRLSPGEWSNWIFDTFETRGGTREGTARFKLIKLSKDAKEIMLYATEVFPVSGFTHPDSLGKELIENVGPFIQGPGRVKARFFDDETFLELMEYHDQWFADATIYLMKKYSWDLYMMQTHNIDYAQHKYLTQADPITKRKVYYSGSYEGRVPARDKCLRYLERVYISADKMIGRIMKEADENIIFIVVSDHGGTAYINDISTADVLQKAGLLAYKEDPKTGLPIIDWSKTKAVPQRSVYIYVNVKGRDPDGIVQPKEYEKVRDEIIETLYDYRDPETGKRPFALALRREDARMIGLYGDLIGDVVYAVHPEFNHEHGQKLPTAKYGMGSLHGVFIISGPQIKKNYIFEDTMWLVDIAPTIAEILEIPKPKDTEGRLLHQLFKEPDKRLKEKEALIKEKNKWKAAYESIQRVTHMR